jgi:hypothetical protein
MLHAKPKRVTGARTGHSFNTMFIGRMTTLWTFDFHHQLLALLHIAYNIYAFSPFLIAFFSKRSDLPSAQ